MFIGSNMYFPFCYLPGLTVWYPFPWSSSNLAIQISVIGAENAGVGKDSPRVRLTLWF